MSKNEIKIRVLPRPGEKESSAPGPSSGTSAAPAASPSPTSRPPTSQATTLLVLGLPVGLAAGLWLFLAPTAGPVADHAAAPVPRSIQAVPLTPQEDRLDKLRVEAELKRAMLRQAAQLENQKIRAVDESTHPVLGPEGSVAAQTFTVDDVNDAARVFEEINLNPTEYADSSPVDKINARLANRKWVNEFERREKVTFVRNFIRAAYERGYEVEINADLVVVGVKPVSKDRKVNIDQVLDRLSSQGP
jgi:hypothetical protein